MSFLVSEQKSKTYIIVNLFQRYLTIGLSIFFMFYMVKGLYGYYTGLIIAEISGVLILLKLYMKNIKFSNFDSSLLKELLLFGMPLIVVEFSGIILTYADRYLLQLLRGAREVGLYSAGYNLSIYCAELLLIPLGLAIQPLYMKIWVDKGDKKTAEFLQKTLQYFLMIAVPVIFGIVSMGRDVLAFLASAKYAQASPVLISVTAGMLIYGCTEILSAGLYVSKKTYLITYMLLAGGIVNIVLNMIMIPRLGVMGAALATLIAYIGLTLARTYFSFKYLRFKICLKSIAKYALFSGVMAYMISLFHAGNPALNIFLKIGAGLLIYSFLLFITTKDIRNRVICRIVR